MNLNRRSFLAASAVATSASAAMAAPVPQPPPVPVPDFTYCLNTSTIREQTEDIEEQVRIASEAGYNGIEPWMRHLTRYTEGGGSLSDLRKRISDAGLTVDSAIGFAQWIVDDPDRRRQALEEARRDMDMLAEIGGTRIAAPPVGAHSKAPRLDLFVVAERYRALLEVGDAAGVVPQLEVWGFSSNLSRLGESTMVCIEAAHPKACLLPDVYHIFKGGSDFAGLSLLHDSAIQVFHLNDYPAEPGREQMNDADRVYPGDGIAPLSQILNMIGGHGRSVVLSLELFNRDYWKQDALDVAKTGLARMKAAVAQATQA
ncbi:MAG: sugar phosphate isomerase/epimerase family protein [Fuerstiella sp.]